MLYRIFIPFGALLLVKWQSLSVNRVANRLLDSFILALHATGLVPCSK